MSSLCAMLKAVFVISTTVIGATFIAVWTRGLITAGHWYAAPLLLTLIFALAWCFDTPESRTDFTAQLKALIAKTLHRR